MESELNPRQLTNLQGYSLQPSFLSCFCLSDKKGNKERGGTDSFPSNCPLSPDWLAETRPPFSNPRRWRRLRYRAHDGNFSVSRSGPARCPSLRASRAPGHRPTPLRAMEPELVAQKPPQPRRRSRRVSELCPGGAAGPSPDNPCSEPAGR